MRKCKFNVNTGLLILLIILTVAILFFMNNTTNFKFVSPIQKTVNTNETAKDLSENAIASTTLMVNTLGMVMTAISLVSIVITIITSTKLNNVDTKLREIENMKIDTQNSRAMLQVLFGIENKHNERYKQAIEDLEQARYIDEEYNDIETLSIVYNAIGATYAELYQLSKYDIECSDKAIKSFEKVIENKANNNIIADARHALGCLYGTKAIIEARNNNNVLCKEANDNFEKAIENFKIAIKKRGDEFIYYKNLSVTYFVKGDDNRGYLNFINSLECDYIKSDQNLKTTFFNNDEMKIIGTKKVKAIIKKLLKYEQAYKSHIAITLM